MTARRSRPPPTGPSVHDLESALVRAERTAQALRDVGLALGSTFDLDQLLEILLSKITVILTADRAILFLLDEQRGRLLTRVVVGKEARAIELPLGEGIAGQVARTGQPLRVGDGDPDKSLLRSWDEVTGYRTRSTLAAPMKNAAGRIIGVIQALNQSKGEEDFSKDDEDLLVALGTQAAPRHRELATLSVRRAEERAAR